VTRVTDPTLTDMSHSAQPLILPSDRRPAAAPVDGEPTPRKDFDALAARLDGRVQYADEATASPMAAIESKLRLSVSQAVRARRSTASAYVALSERIGLPLSLLPADAPRIQVAHLLTSPQKRRMAQMTGYLRRTDATLVFSRPQEHYLREEVGLEPERAQFIPDKVDHRFFTPGGRGDGGYVLSVGREQRDYETLVDALAPLRVPGVIVSGSPWSHRSGASLSVPDHVTVQSGLSYPALRDLYRNARAVVIPVFPGTTYAAGVNGILEAMACATPVIASDTPGLSGYVRDGIDGRTVAPGDATQLRHTVQELWEDPAQARRLGDAGRDIVERDRTVDHFVERVAGVVTALS
jgi:glycosyltransferase involved in cell wall biosynthesis